MSGRSKQTYGINMYHLLCLAFLGQLTSAMQVLLTFREPTGSKLQNMVRDRVSGNVFIGATNKLLKLSSDLTLLESTSVGPREDNPNCPPPLSVCFENKTDSNSYSKGLAIDYENSAIISCSTLFHGFCQRRPLANIEQNVEDFYEFLVSNDPMINNILFVAPGLGGKDVLYIGSTYTIIGSTIYRDSVPSISSRQLDNLKYLHKDQNGGTLINVIQKYRSEFLVEFIHGFSYGNFVYFITTHRNSLKSTIMETTIVRLCTSDKYFRSYVEIPVRCHRNGVEYSVAKAAHFDGDSENLMIAFAQVQDNFPDELSGSSALCSFKIANVERDFNRTVEECHKGNGRLGPAHIHRPQTCIQTSASFDMCASSEVAEAYSAIEGQTTISSRPLIVFPQSVISAIAVTHAGSHMITFLGTLEGELKKVVVSPEGLVTVVDKLDVDNGQPINREMYFDNKQNNLYVLTRTKLSKVSVKHCEEKKTCQDCTVSGDPLCGWCVMENECRLKADCPSAVIVPHWLPSSGRTCAHIADMSPDILSFESLEHSHHGQQITFTMKEVSLSVPDADINCYFVSSDSQIRTAAILQDKSVTCPVPERSQLPRLPVDHHSIELQFHVQGHAIMKRSVELYDCQVHQNCTACAGSMFGCQWCYASHSCTSGTTNSCAGQDSSGITNSNSCPRIESPSQDTDIVVHSGEEKRIVFRVINLQPGQTDNVKCQFEYFEKSQIVMGTIDSANNLICDTVKFSFDNESPYVTAAFAVTWGNQNISLDNPRAIKVRIYKCPLMVTNCGKCLSMDPEYECGWCDTSCTLQKHCTVSWLDRSSTCPDPFILRFSPTTGPIQGKTNISVTGINLGKAYTDITVTVANVTCIILPTHYEPSSRFICETEISGKEKSGNIQVEVDGKFSAHSASQFSFITPEVSKLHPLEGPTSGGTMVTITGTSLNTGSSITVDIGGSNCDVVRINSTVIQCLTSRHVDNLVSSEVEVNFGGFRRLLTSKFTYQEDPVITMIEPKKTILSGGTKITVMGTRLKQIQNPQFFVEVGGSNITTACVHSNTLFLWLLCKTPRLKLANENITDTNPKEIHFGFNLDGVTTWQNISRDPNFGPILYYPDPVVDMFEGEKSTKKFAKDDVLVIQGKFRSVSPLMSDVLVMVGLEKCKNPAATDTAITCDAPVKPRGIAKNGNALVQIKIGNLHSDVGFLNYYEVEEIGKPIAIGIILGVALPILAIIVLLTVCVIRRHRKHGPSENYIPDVLKDYEGKKEEEDIGMNHVSTVKADMNGQIPDDKDSPYIAELLENIEDETVRQKVKEVLIPRSKLEIGELIAKGNFGPTYKANYKQSEKSIPTAVKCLQSTNTDRDVLEGFLQRCAVMHDIQHPNVLPVMGVCLTASDDPLVVLPYTEHGDIKTCIREPSKNITVLELLEMAQQIAEGMAYLEEMCIIHRNLSARNCLLQDKTVKVSDYGLTKDLFSKEYYFSDDNRSKLLTKWLAPETLENFEFSTQTDVWSYGIVLWELLTRGVTPYPDVEAKDLIEYIKSGNRMKKPRQCPENIYQLMLRCWAHNPDERPTFCEISNEIQKYVQTDAQEDVDTAAQPLKTSIKFSSSTEFIHNDS